MKEHIVSPGMIDPGHALRVIRWLNGLASYDERSDLAKYFAITFCTSSSYQLDRSQPIESLRILINSTSWGACEPRHKVTARACAALSPPGYSYGWNDEGVISHLNLVIEVPHTYCCQAWNIWQERYHVGLVDGPAAVARVDQLIEEWQAFK